jgi:hypothetical protein
MAHPDKEQFAVMLRQRKHSEIVEEHILSGQPFAFENDQPSYDLLRAEISRELTVDVPAIHLVGSGQIGFSLAPEKFGTPFRPESDLDIAVVDSQMFDEAWMDMLRLGNAYYSLKQRVRDMLKQHRENNIYWGMMYPDSLPGVVRISSKWFSAFKGLSRNRQFASREVSGRLYRTRDHLVIHQEYSCAAVLKRLSKI